MPYASEIISQNNCLITTIVVFPDIIVKWALELYSIKRTKNFRLQFT